MCIQTVQQVMNSCWEPFGGSSSFVDMLWILSLAMWPLHKMRMWHVAPSFDFPLERRHTRTSCWWTDVDLRSLTADSPAVHIGTLHTAHCLRTCTLRLRSNLISSHHQMDQPSVEGLWQSPPHWTSCLSCPWRRQDRTGAASWMTSAHEVLRFLLVF